MAHQEYKNYFVIKFLILMKLHALRMLTFSGDNKYTTLLTCQMIFIYTESSQNYYPYFPVTIYSVNSFFYLTLKASIPGFP